MTCTKCYGRCMTIRRSRDWWIIACTTCRSAIFYRQTEQRGVYHTVGRRYV